MSTAPLDAKSTNPREGGVSFPLRHRLLRALFGVVWAALGVWPPAPFNRLRRLILTAFGAKLHATAKVYPGVRVWYPPNLEMKAHACLGPGVNCYSMAKIVLDDYALASQGAYLCGGTHDIDDPHFQLQARPIHIGANAWVAANAFVGPGVSLGEGSVLGACAVTVKNLQPWTVYVGNPAHAIRSRDRARFLGETGR